MRLTQGGYFKRAICPRQKATVASSIYLIWFVLQVVVTALVTTSKLQYDQTKIKAHGVPLGRAGVVQRPTRVYKGEQIHKLIIGLLPRKNAKSQQLVT